MSENMEENWGENDLGDEAAADRSPICAACGVSCLPPETPGEDAICENPDCDAFGEPVS